MTIKSKKKIRLIRHLDVRFTNYCRLILREAYLGDKLHSGEFSQSAIRKQTLFPTVKLLKVDSTCLMSFHVNAVYASDKVLGLNGHRRLGVRAAGVKMHLLTMGMWHLPKLMIMHMTTMIQQ